MSTSFICSDHTFRSIIIDGLILQSNSGPYHMSLLTCHAVAFATFIITSATGNLSQVCKLWSILPTIYAWMCVVDSRTTLMACLSTLWSLRLTYNFYRRGVSACCIIFLLALKFTSPKDDACYYILDRYLHTFLTLFAYVDDYIICNIYT